MTKPISLTRPQRAVMSSFLKAANEGRTIDIHQCSMDHNWLGLHIAYAAFDELVAIGMLNIVPAVRVEFDAEMMNREWPAEEKVIETTNLHAETEPIPVDHAKAKSDEQIKKIMHDRTRHGRPGG